MSKVHHPKHCAYLRERIGNAPQRRLHAAAEQLNREGDKLESGDLALNLFQARGEQQGAIKDGARLRLHSRQPQLVRLQTSGIYNFAWD